MDNFNLILVVIAHLVAHCATAFLVGRNGAAAINAAVAAMAETLRLMEKGNDMPHKDPAIELVPDGGKVGPYEAVYSDSLRNYNEELGRFRVFMSGAYNAYGLIGTEYNGIVILDNKRMLVVCDRLHRQSSGFYGHQKPPVNMSAAHDMFMHASDKDFHRLVSESKYLRYEIDPPL